METRKIGSLDVPVVGLGCNNFGFRLDERGSAEVIHAALDAGVTFFDTADSYGQGRSETFLGRTLGDRRRDVVIATKFGSRVEGQGSGARPEYVRTAAEASLRRLGTDYIDLYQLHKPDPAVPIADTLGALDELVREGKVREIGCSNFTVDMLRDAREAAGTERARFASVQNEYSLFHREPEEGVLQECARQGMAFLPYYPLASGLLTGKYRKGRELPEGTRIADVPRYRESATEEALNRVEAWTRVAESRGRTLLELAFAWLLRQPSVASVIAGATKPAQVRANAEAARWRMTEAEVAEVA